MKNHLAFRCKAALYNRPLPSLLCHVHSFFSGSMIRIYKVLNFVNRSGGYPPDIHRIPAPPQLYTYKKRLTSADLRPDLQNSVPGLFDVIFVVLSAAAPWNFHCAGVWPHCCCRQNSIFLSRTIKKTSANMNHQGFCYIGASQV